MVLAISTPALVVIIVLLVKQISVIKIVPKFDVQAGTKNHTEDLEDRQTETNSTQYNQMFFGCFQKFVYATLQIKNPLVLLLNKKLMIFIILVEQWWITVY